jgi:hypothetical protein
MWMSLFIMKRKNMIILSSATFASIFLVFFSSFYLIPLISETKPVYIAPYVTYTHPCSTHGSGCQAEFPNLQVNYIITSDDGSVNVQSTVTTGSNGFFTVNMPYDKSYTIQMEATINSSLYRGSSTFETGVLSSDCITEGKLVQ